MNFVVVAPCFYPKDDAESYCSTRFASALAKLGHSVEVVTAWQPDETYENSYPQLVHPNLRITRVRPRGEDLVAPCVAATREALARHEKPVLVTRSYPWLSLHVGWRCRKSAAKWIQHFSDPMVDTGDPSGRLAPLRNWMQRWWMRRAMRKADAISVTCRRVTRFYREYLGPCVDRVRFIRATHIGDFKLEKSAAKVEFASHVIYHDGDIYSGRGLLMLEAVERLNREDFPCIFLQGRDVVCESDRKRLLACPHCRIVGKDAAPGLKALARAASVSFVADFDMPQLAYSPFLMSKFVYQLFSEKPMVVLAKRDSEKHDYCAAYPEAGLFYAEIGNVDSLVAAIRAAFACDPKTIDRTRIRAAFSEETVGRQFVAEVS